MGNNFEVVTYIYLVHVCRRKKSNVCVLVKIDSGGLTCTPLYWRNTSNEKLSTAITFTDYLLPTSAMRWYVRLEVSCSSSEYMSAWLTPSRHVNHKLQTYLIWIVVQAECRAYFLSKLFHHYNLSHLQYNGITCDSWNILFSLSSVVVFSLLLFNSLTSISLDRAEDIVFSLSKTLTRSAEDIGTCSIAGTFRSKT